MPRGGSKKGAATPKVARTPAATPKAKAARTPSRGRKAAPKTPEEIVTVFEMAFTEGDKVMAKWPGTNLYFKAKVTFVRDEDNEYDVQVCKINLNCKGTSR